MSELATRWCKVVLCYRKQTGFLGLKYGKPTYDGQILYNWYYDRSVYLGTHAHLEEYLDARVIIVDMDAEVDNATHSV